MNLSNKITISRILIMPFFMVSVEASAVLWKIFAIVFFTYACYSDWLDGALARRHGWVTDFGKFADPLADKIFVCSAFIAFVGDAALNIPAWMVTLIIGREFMITGFRTLAVSKDIVLPAQMLGKVKTVVQLSAIGAIIFISFLYSLEISNILYISIGFGVFLSYVPIVLMSIVVLATVLSGIKYIYDNRSLLQ